MLGRDFATPRGDDNAEFYVASTARMCYKCACYLPTALAALVSYICACYLHTAIMFYECAWYLHTAVMFYIDVTPPIGE